MYNSPIKIEVLRAFSYYGTKYSTTDNDSNQFGYGFPVGYWIRNIDSHSLNNIIIPQYQYNEKSKLFIGIEKTTNLAPMETLIIPTRYLMLLLFEGKVEITNGRFDQVFDVRFNRNIEDYEVNAWEFHPQLSDLDCIFYRDIGAMPEKVIENKSDEPYKYENEPSIRKYEKIVDPKYFSLFGNFNNCDITKLPKEFNNQLSNVSNSTLFLNSILSLNGSRKKEEPRKTMYSYYMDIGSLSEYKFNIAKVSSTVQLYYMSHTFGRLKLKENGDYDFKDYKSVRNKFDHFMFDGEVYYTMFPSSPPEEGLKLDDVRVLRNYYVDQEYLKNYQRIVDEFKQKLEFRFLDRYIKGNNGYSIVFKEALEDDINTDNTFNETRILNFYQFRGKSIILPNYKGTLLLDYINFINYNIDEIDVPNGSVEISIKTNTDFDHTASNMNIKKLRASSFRFFINNKFPYIGDLDIDKQKDPFKVIIDEMVITHSDRFISEVYYCISRVTFDKCYNAIGIIKKFIIEEKENLIPFRNNTRWDQGYFKIETIEGMGELICGSGLFPKSPIKRDLFADSSQIRKPIKLLKDKTFYVLGRNRYPQERIKKWVEGAGGILTNKVENADYVICEDNDLRYKYVTSRSLTRPKIISSHYLYYLERKSLGVVEVY